ncbi:hypothetical protein D9619_008240 [Psilocybe cf. subviscida]|uniref:WSC domain-containing protein n=1 Tax=Psilocybe cf. subviscida TaxID=2480587 RepID=A0A8H5AT97_9AGAR|nr:hypothetical protein D9619_008240 [Psilocybe cf. subviscida]
MLLHYIKGSATMKRYTQGVFALSSGRTASKMTFLLSQYLVAVAILLGAHRYIFVHASPLEERQSSLPTGWVPFGCFSDTSASRTLKIASFSDVTNMTIESCIAFCAPAEFLFAGVEFSRECFCDNVIESPGAPIDSSTCNMPCTGNSGEICGGSGAISIFQNTAGPKIIQTAGTYQYLGCYQDGVNGAPRSLQHQLSVTGGMSAEKCAAACKAAGFVLAGLEFGQECWCDSYFPSPVLVPDTDCNIACTGDNTEVCGAGNRLAVYQDTSAPALNLSACLTCSQLRSGTTSGAASFTLIAQPLASAAAPSATPTPFRIAGLELPARKEEPTFANLVAFTPGLDINTFILGCDDGTHGQTFTLQGPGGGTGGFRSLPFSVGSVIELADRVGMDPAPVGQGFCAQPNGFSKSSYIGPPLLGGNQLSNQWGFCGNTVVFGFQNVTVPCPQILLEMSLIS